MKHYKNTVFLIGLCFVVLGMAHKTEIPESFINVKEVIPDIEVKLSYYSTNNFVGDTIDGYESNTLYLTKAAASKLKLVQDELQKQNLCLYVFDGYRPQIAVNHFVRWARKIDDTLKKPEFYPDVDKRNLFKLGYIASKSGHSRGSTVDLTITSGETGTRLDMGTPFDFFGEQSGVYYQDLTEEQKKNRMLLKTVMNANGFRSYPKEWWHFTLRNEPFLDTYYNFPIKD